MQSPSSEIEVARCAFWGPKPDFIASNVPDFLPPKCALTNYKFGESSLRSLLLG